MILIHKATFDSAHFTKYFPNYLLAKYFTELINKMKFKFVCLDDNNKVNGYLFADHNPSKIVDDFRKKNVVSILIVLLLNPKFLKEKMYEFMYNKREEEKKTFQISLYLIATDPKYKGQGVASSILKFFEGELKDKGCESYFLFVRKENLPAIKFYTRYGFQEKSRDEKSIKFERILI